MSRRDDSISLRHMLDYAREAVALAQDRSRAELDSDRMFMHTSTRLVEIIGEAARRVSSETRRRRADIPWADMTGARDRLIHAYDKVDLDILWDILELDLPTLVDQLEKILSEIGSG